MFRIIYTFLDKTRWSEAIVLPSGEAICISNQIGDKSDFNVYRNCTVIRNKLINYGFRL